MPATATPVTALSGRCEFSALRRKARRGRSGPVTVLAAPDDELGAVAVAYAIRTAAGTAV